MITEGQVLDIAKDAIYYIIICSAPVLIISLVVGLIISIFQTVTSIQEQTLMVELQYLSWIGLTYGAVFIFIGKF